MKLAVAAALAAVCCAAPAGATSGFLCSPLSGTGPSVSLVIGHGLGSLLAGANLSVGGVTRSTLGEGAPLVASRSWIDEDRLWLDLTDSNLMRYEARLRAQWTGRGRNRLLAGTLVVGGRLYRVSCEES